MISNVSKLVLMTALGMSALASQAQTLVSTITLPAPSNQLAVDPLMNRVYVTVPSPTGQNFDYLTVINGKTDTITTNIKIHPIATAVAVDDVRQLVYVGGTYMDPKSGITFNQLAQIDASSKKVVRYITVSNTLNEDGGQINGIAVNLANGDIWVANGSDNEIDVVTAAGKIKQRIATPEAPIAVTVNPIVGNAYVALTEPLSIGSSPALFDVIGLKTYAVTTVAFGDAGTSNQGVAVNPLTGNVYVANSPFNGGVGTVGVFNSAGVLQTTLVASQSPQGIDADFITNRAYVANNGNDTISVINGASNPATISDPLPFSASWLALNPVTSKVYMSSSTNDYPGNFLTVIHE